MPLLILITLLIIESSSPKRAEASLAVQSCIAQTQQPNFCICIHQAIQNNWDQIYGQDAVYEHCEKYVVWKDSPGSLPGVHIFFGL